MAKNKAELLEEAGSLGLTFTEDDSNEAIAEGIAAHQAANPPAADAEPTGSKAARSKASADGGASEVAEKIADAEEQGFLGQETDPTPNENYTFGGNDLPTPETDPKLAAKAKKAGGL